MARNQFALERSRKISIAIKGYDAAAAAKTQQVKHSKRLARLRAQQQRSSNAQTDAQRRSRYEEACSEMADFNSLNEALAKPVANTALIEAFLAPSHPSSLLMH